jgi:hypothetical protein
MDRSNRDVRFYSESGHYRLALSVGPLAALGEGQEPQSARRKARGRGGLGSLTLAAKSARYGTLFIKIGADVITMLPSAIRAIRKGKGLGGENHSYREGDAH